MTNGTNHPRYVVIVSTPRSGSSWLSRLLRSHPGLRVYTHNAGDNYRLYVLNPLRSLSPWSDDAAPPGTVSPFRSRLLRRLFPRSRDGGVVVVQTPTLGPFLPYFIGAFPDARFIHLERDPLDTIVSLGEHMASTIDRSAGSRFRAARYRGRNFAARSAFAHLFHSLRWLRCPHEGYLFARPSGFHEFVRTPRLDFLARYYAAYESDIRAALALVPEHRVKMLSYEALVNSLDSTFAELLRFIGVPAWNAPDRGTRKVRPGSVGRHRRDLSDTDIAHVQRILQESGLEIAREIRGDLR